MKLKHILQEIHAFIEKLNYKYINCIHLKNIFPSILQLIY